MLKYSLQLNGDIDLFVSTFSAKLQSLFNFVSVDVDTSNQTKITVTDSRNNKQLLYFFVTQTTYNNRTTLLLKTYGLNIYPNEVVNEDTSDWGPMVVYENSGTTYGRAGFITASEQIFIIDTISYCLDNNNIVKYFISFECNEITNPMFVITPTNLNNIGFIGATTFTNSNVGIRTLTFNNNRTVEHNVITSKITNSSVTSMTKFFIPESTNSEYFEYAYLINGLENVEVNTFNFEGHMYLPCMNKSIALLIY